MLDCWPKDTQEILPMFFFFFISGCDKVNNVKYVINNLILIFTNFDVYMGQS